MCPAPINSYVSVPNGRLRDTVGQFTANSSVGLATCLINWSSVTTSTESSSNCGGNSALLFTIPSHWLALGLITTTIRSNPKLSKFGQRFRYHYQMPKLSHNSNKVIRGGFVRTLPTSPRILSSHTNQLVWGFFILVLLECTSFWSALAWCKCQSHFWSYPGCLQVAANQPNNLCIKLRYVSSLGQATTGSPLVLWHRTPPPPSS